ncbi:MAG: Gfo/Idh/MocA family oxidoreductase [Kineosporiaceae bacterium]
MTDLAIGLIGTKFMGRAHANAWTQVTRFFDPPLTPVRHTVAGRDATATEAFATRWGWQHATTDVAALVTDPAISLVDVCTPNHAHAEAAIGALEAGKHVACEKPLAATLADARAMTAAAAAASGRTFVWFSYRRVPAIAFARALVRQGRLGAIRHVRAIYLQQWGIGADDVWRFDAAVAGSGALGDIAAHIVDAVQFVTGEQVARIAGSLMRTYVPSHSVDDAVIFLGELDGGATASFEATRFATGHHNTHGFEIHGEHGAVRFRFDQMGRLDVYDATAERAVRGWTTVEVGDAEAGHPWVGAWWPPGHPIGYEHTFTHQAADILEALAGRPDDALVAPMPDFAEALQVQTVLEAAAASAGRRAAVEVAEIAAT